jgi:hypothetical protein
MIRDSLAGMRPRRLLAARPVSRRRETAANAHEDNSRNRESRKDIIVFHEFAADVFEAPARVGTVRARGGGVTPLALTSAG